MTQRSQQDSQSLFAFMADNRFLNFIRRNTSDNFYRMAFNFQLSVVSIIPSVLGSAAYSRYRFQSRQFEVSRFFKNYSVFLTLKDYLRHKLQDINLLSVNKSSKQKLINWIAPFTASLLNFPLFQMRTRYDYLFQTKLIKDLEYKKLRKYFRDYGKSWPSFYKQYLTQNFPGFFLQMVTKAFVISFTVCILDSSVERMRQISEQWIFLYIFTASASLLTFETMAVPFYKLSLMKKENKILTKQRIYWHYKPYLSFWKELFEEKNMEIISKRMKSNFFNHYHFFFGLTLGIYELLKFKIEIDKL